MIIKTFLAEYYTYPTIVTGGPSVHTHELVWGSIQVQNCTITKVVAIRKT